MPERGRRESGAVLSLEEARTERDAPNICALSVTLARFDALE